METILAIAISASLRNPYVIIEDTYKVDPVRAEQMELIVEFLEVVWGPEWWVNKNMPEEKQVETTTRRESKPIKPVSKTNNRNNGSFKPSVAP